MHYETSIDVDATTDAVWPVMADVERWSEWTPSIRDVTPLTKDGLRVGFRARVRQPRLPVAVWEVTDLEPGRSFTWVNRSAGLTSTGVHRVEPTGDGRSRVLLAISQTGPLAFVARAFAPLTRKYVAMEAAGLKQRCER